MGFNVAKPILNLLKLKFRSICFKTFYWCFCPFFITSDFADAIQKLTQGFPFVCPLSVILRVPPTRKENQLSAPLLQRRPLDAGRWTINRFWFLHHNRMYAQATPSYIRKENHNPATTTPMYVCMSC